MLLLDMTHLPPLALYPNEIWGNCDNCIWKATEKDQSSHCFNLMTSTAQQWRHKWWTNCAPQRAHVLRNPKAGAFSVVTSRSCQSLRLYSVGDGWMNTGRQWNDTDSGKLKF